MVKGDLATEFNPLFGRMLRASINRKRATISQHLGVGPHREICRPALPALWLEAVGAQALARALVDKAVYNPPYTRATIEALRATPVCRRICGFVRRSDVPSEATLSRAFAEFAEIGLGDRVHEALVGLWVTPRLVGHIRRDATVIEGRERHAPKPKPPKPAPRKKGRPRRGEVREPKPATRLERQCRQSAQEALTELPVLPTGQVLDARTWGALQQAVWPSRVRPARQPF